MDPEPSDPEGAGNLFKTFELLILFWGHGDFLILSMGHRPPDPAPGDAGQEFILYSIPSGSC